MRTKYFLIGILSFCQNLLLFSQNNLDEVLYSIEKNNTTLKALRQSAEAQKLENKTGIYLPNPEVDFGYLWGTPAPIGNRTDINAVQRFDIPTISGMKSRLADKQNISVEWQFKSERMNILLEVKQLCMDLIFYNSLKREFVMRLSHAQSIADIYEKRLAGGDASRLEYNKAQLNLVTVQGELSRVEVERGVLLSELKRLNGGMEIVLPDDHFEPTLLPPSFEDWYTLAEQKNPVLAYVKQETEVSKSLLKVNRAKGLPSFSAGYTSEKIVGEHFQGIKIGVTIPLWENKNRVAQAKASVLATEARLIDGRQKFYSRVKNQYERAVGLQAIAQKYRNLRNSSNSAELLKKALDAGEISLLNYLTELGMYYNMANLTLEAERDYQKAVTELLAVEL